MTRVLINNQVWTCMDVRNGGGKWLVMPGAMTFRRLRGRIRRAIGRARRRRMEAARRARLLVLGGALVGPGGAAALQGRGAGGVWSQQVAGT